MYWIVIGTVRGQEAASARNRVPRPIGPDESGAPLIAEITPDDIASALDAAGRIGDDFIQTELGGGTVDQDAFTHGSSEQRQRWFTTGYQTGDPTACDTFGTDDLG